MLQQFEMNYIPNLKYKTMLCEKWENNQFCPKASSCYFAHGDTELRTIQQNQIVISQQNKAMLVYNNQLNLPNNYKTIKCKFYARGKCQLGKNCTFYHTPSQKRKPSKLEAQNQAPNIENTHQYYNYQMHYSAYWDWNNQGYIPYHYNVNAYNDQPQQGAILSENLNNSEEYEDQIPENNPKSQNSEIRAQNTSNQFLKSSLETNESLKNNI